MSDDSTARDVLARLVMLYRTSEGLDLTPPAREWSERHRYFTVGMLTRLVIELLIERGKMRKSVRAMKRPRTYVKSRVP